MTQSFEFKINKNDIVRKLQKFRDAQAKKQKTEPYKILQNATIFEISEKMPATPQELLDVKGIGEKKLIQFGDQILKMIHGEVENTEKVATEQNSKNEIFSVSSFLDYVNEILIANVESYAIQGEISSLNMHTSGVYFTIQDKEDESILNCWMPPRFYETLGFAIEEGMEVKIEGYPNIHKPKGRFSFVVENLELAGEGSLKKAYELLKKKLKEEGIFERKRPLPENIEKIGLITSKTSAAIDDFRKNLEKRGYQIKFVNVFVEGSKAVKDIERAVKSIQSQDLDVLVVTRGGGGLEDLQAFNNENVVRAMFASGIPTIGAIGHERDVPIASLVSDVSVSTPTAAAMMINSTWEKVEESLPDFQNKLFYKFQDVISARKSKILLSTQEITSYFNSIFQQFKIYDEKLSVALDKIGGNMSRMGEKVDLAGRELVRMFEMKIRSIKDKVYTHDKYLESNNPERNLKLGYCIITDETGRVIKSVKNVKINENLVTKVADGSLESEVKKININ